MSEKFAESLSCLAHVHATTTPGDLDMDDQQYWAHIEEAVLEYVKSIADSSEITKTIDLFVERFFSSVFVALCHMCFQIDL